MQDVVRYPLCPPSLPILTVEEHDVLRDRVAPDAQFVGREVGVRITDGQGAYDRKFRRNLLLVTN